MKQVSAKEFMSWLESNECEMLDVREVFEYQDYHIPGSINVPLGNIALSFPEHLAKTNKKIVLICAAGKRSSIAIEIIKENYPDLDLYNLYGGLSALDTRL